MPAQLLRYFFFFIFLRCSVSPQKRVMSGLWRFHHALADHFKDLSLAEFRNQESKNMAPGTRHLRNERSRTNTANHDPKRLQFVHGPKDCHSRSAIPPHEFCFAGQPLARLVFTRRNVLLNLFKYFPILMNCHFPRSFLPSALGRGRELI